MSEQTYVFTVEALIIGLCNVNLVAQRWDVFTWPLGRTWPVLGTTVLILLAYAQLLLSLACFIKISNLTALSLEICEALARCVGRFCTMSVGVVIYMSCIVWVKPKNEWALTLCQFWGTGCREAGNSQIWSYSYSIYLGILLPCLALQAGLQIIAASSLKLTHYAPRRILSLNGLFLLTLHGAHTLNENYIEACDGANGECRTNPVTNMTYFSTSKNIEAKTITSSMLLFLAFFFVCSDIATDICAALVTKHNKVAVIAFILCRLLQVVAIPMVVFALHFDFPPSLTITHIGLATFVAILDVSDVGTQYFKAPVDNKETEQADEEKDTDEEAEDIGEKPLSANSAFTLEAVRRKRFVFSVGNKTKWPHRTRPVAGINKKSQ